MMKNVKHLDPGRKNCETAAYGVMSAPEMAVEGKAVHVGDLPGPDQAHQRVNKQDRRRSL